MLGRMTTALITGASSGLGEEFAAQLAASGHDLVLVARDEVALDRVAGRLRAAHGIRARVLPADLTTDAGLAAVSRRLAAGGPDAAGQDEAGGDDDGLGPVDLLVANAGLGLATSFTGSPLDEEVAMLSLLTTGVLVPAHAAARSMRSRGRGAIITVASVAAWVPGGTYSAAKAWALTFTESLAAELAGTGVTATAVCPGFTRTRFHERAGLDASALPRFAWLDASEVVRQGLADARAGRAVSVPGLGYRVLTCVLDVLPRGAVRALTGTRRAGR